VRFGAHLSIGGGFAKAAGRARALGCETLQLFSGNPRGWAKEPLDETDVAAFRAALAAAGIGPVVVHATYLINLAAPDEIYFKSVAAFCAEAGRTAALGAPYYVTHLGSHRGSGWEAGAAKIAAALDSCAAETPAELTFCLENTSGMKNSLGTSFEELARLLEKVRSKERIGFCLDTCHAFAAGYDVAKRAGLKKTLDEFDRLIGLERLKVLHLNDSKGELGSHKDRHEHIGEGHIGAAGFRLILREKRLAHLPGILETPQKEEGDDVRNLAAVRRLAARAGGARAPSPASKKKAVRPKKKTKAAKPGKSKRVKAKKKKSKKSKKTRKGKR